MDFGQVRIQLCCESIPVLPYSSSFGSLQWPMQSIQQGCVCVGCVWFLFCFVFLTHFSAAKINPKIKTKKALTILTCTVAAFPLTIPSWTLISLISLSLNSTSSLMRFPLK